MFLSGFVFVFFSVLIAHNLPYGVAKLKEREYKCDEVILNATSGQILSPNISIGGHAYTYPKLSNCEWYIQNQPGMTIKLRYASL